MGEVEYLKVTCEGCKTNFSVPLDNTWKAVSSETVTKKKLFKTVKVSEIIWEKEVECPNCHVKSTGRLTTSLQLG